MSTTAGRAYVAHDVRPYVPVHVRSEPLFAMDPGAGATRSTTADAFRGSAGRASTPIYPKSNGRVYGSDIPASFQTTAGCSYVPHSVKAFKMANGIEGTFKGI